jgi:DNA-binding SARP family transcriptional activator
MCPMSRLAQNLLGPPRIELDGEPAQISRRKVLALLAYLASTRQPHSRDALATLLWPEYDQSGARGRLRRTLSTLNRALDGEWFAADRETIGLNRDSDLWLDVSAFRQWLAACDAHDHPLGEACDECRELLIAAVELHRDDFMAGFTLPDSLAFDEWQRFQTQRLCDELGDALERLVLGHSAAGDYDRAMAHGQRWLALDPTHEPAHRQLMGLS